MNSFESVVCDIGCTDFPEFTGERVYMREFRKADGLPFDLRRWQPTIDSMLQNVDTDGPLYLMIDQGVVRAGASHRRPGAHIDGYWHPEVHAHGGGGGGHSGRASEQQRKERGGHSGRGSHGGGRHSSGKNSWAGADYVEHEGILLASSVQAARAFSGVFTGQPGVGGDCAHIDVAGMIEVSMQAGHVYAGNVTMLHESLPVAFDCARSLVRINVPGWHPN